MSRMPPIFRGGLSWACAALALRANDAAKMPDKILFIEKTSLDRLPLNGGLVIGTFATIMPHARERSKREVQCQRTIGKHISAKRNGEMRLNAPAVIASAAKQSRLPRRELWIASLRSQ